MLKNDAGLLVVIAAITLAMVLWAPKPQLLRCAGPV